MKEILEELARQSILIVKRLGEKGRKNVPAPKGKRTCLAELKIYENAAANLGNDVYLLAEGFPAVGNPDSNMKVTLDTMDGTLYYVRQKSLNPFPITIPFSAIQGDNYKDIVAAAVGDITSGEIWSADKFTQTRSSALGDVVAGDNREHNSLLQSDMYFLENASARLNIKNPENTILDRVECQNAGSIVSQLVRVATSEADAYIGVGGPTSWEAAPGYLLIKQAGGSVISLNTGKDLGEETFSSDERVPLIAARNEELAMQLYNQIKA